MLTPESLQSISEYFDVSLEVTGLTITVFLLGYCAGPLPFAPLSEFYERRYIFYITFLSYLAFTFLCAVYLSFVYLLMYMLFSMYPIIFQKKRSWNSGIGELPLLGTVVGAFIGAMLVLWDSRRQQRVIDPGGPSNPRTVCPWPWAAGSSSPPASSG